MPFTVATQYSTDASDMGPFLPCSGRPGVLDRAGRVSGADFVCPVFQPSFFPLSLAFRILPNLATTSSVSQVSPENRRNTGIFSSFPGFSGVCRGGSGWNLNQTPWGSNWVPGALIPRLSVRVKLVGPWIPRLSVSKVWPGLLPWVPRLSVEGSPAFRFGEICAQMGPPLFQLGGMATFACAGSPPFGSREIRVAPGVPRLFRFRVIFVGSRDPPLGELLGWSGVGSGEGARIGTSL